MVVKQHLTKFF